MQKQRIHPSAWRGTCDCYDKIKINYTVMLLCMLTHRQVWLLLCCLCLVPN